MKKNTFLSSRPYLLKIRTIPKALGIALVFLTFMANSQVLKFHDPIELPKPPKFHDPIELYDYHEPEVPENVSKTQFSEYGGVHTPQGELKVLLVFAQFEGDMVNSNDWPKNQLPDFNDVLYTDVNQFLIISLTRFSIILRTIILIITGLHLINAQTGQILYMIM